MTMVTFLTEDANETAQIYPALLKDNAEVLETSVQQLQQLLEHLGISIESIVSITQLKPFELMEEKAPMIVIGQNVLFIKYKNSQDDETTQEIAIGTLFNPGFVPHITTCGLALTQVAVCQVEHTGKKDGWPPMVVSMGHCSIEDGETSSNNSLFLAVTINDPKKLISKDARILDITGNAVEEVGNASFQLMPLPVKRLAKFDRGLDGSPLAAAKDHYDEHYAKDGKALTDLPVPNFGNDLVVESLREISPKTRVGLVNFKRGPNELFPGHFPGSPIIPLAGAAIPAFTLVEQWFKELTGVLPEDFSIQDLGKITPHKPLSPTDTILIEAELLTAKSADSDQVAEKQHIFNVKCSYFDKMKQKIDAVTFESITVKVQLSKALPWAKRQVAEAFSYQARILQEAYRNDHLKVLERALQEVIQDMKGQDSLSFLDLGTGEVANVPLLVLGLVNELRSRVRECDITLSDVQPEIIDAATKVVENFLSKKTADKEGNFQEVAIEGTQYHIHRAATGQMEGVHVVPSDVNGPFDVITANFALDYTGVLEDELRRAASMLRPGGSVVLGFVQKNPPYYLLVPEALKALEKNNWKGYDKMLTMSEVGRGLARLSVLGNSNLVHYRDAAEVCALLQANGFSVKFVEQNTYKGNGFIVSAQRVA